MSGSSVVKAWSLRGVTFGLALLVAASVQSAEGQSKKSAKPTKGQAADSRARSDDRFWQTIAEQEPNEMMGLRSLFGYMLRLCESRQHPERMARLCQLAAKAQDRDPKSPGYGNLKWTWRDKGVTDYNAVEFVTQDAAIIWMQHRDWLPEPVRTMVREILTLNIEGCLRHQVPVSYTNIAVLNAANLIALGEMFERPEVADEGYWRLDAICLWTWAYGTHEYCSPTYYAVNLNGMNFIRSHAQRERGRRQAEAMLDLLWFDIALNWFTPAGRLSGAHSRSYDYLHGLGDLNAHVERWLGAGKQSAAGADAWSPPAPLRELCEGQYPRLVRQAWGIRPSQSRTHVLYPDITLSCAGAMYGSQDITLAADLPGDQSLVRCYFIPDGREDPYGKKRYETSSARHLKALHLAPFWAGAQRNRDALGLAIYRPQDLTGQEVFNLQSHFVLRRGVDELWLGDRKVELQNPKEQERKSIALADGQTLIVRRGTAALGIRLVWARAQNGQPVGASLVDDGNAWGALRLTVEHRREHPSAEAGVAFWVRIGSGLKTQEAFAQWRKRFNEARPTRVEADAKQVRLEVPGEDGPVAVCAAAPYGLGGGVALQPEPSRGVLEFDGRDLGRPSLERIEPIRAFRGKPNPLTPIRVEPDHGTYWEAEAGLIFPGMTIADDPLASGKQYVWQPDEKSSHPKGSVTWAFEVPKAGRYYLWGRVQAPDSSHDSFGVWLIGDGCPWPAKTGWHIPDDPQWRWRPVCLEKSRTPIALELSAGTCHLQFTLREPGTKVDRLFLTADPNEKPR